MPTIDSWARRLAVVATLAIPAGARADAPPSPVAAGAPSSLAFTEAAFVAAAVARAPEATAAQASRAAAVAAIDVARRRPEPRLAWEHDDLLTDGRLDRVTVEVPVDLSPRRAALVRAAAHEVAAQDAEAARAERRVALAAAEAYLTAAAARQRRLALEAARAPVADLAARIAAQAAAGAASGYDADRVALELAVVDADLAQAQGDEVVAEVALGAWVGAARATASDPLTLPAAPPPVAIAADLEAAPAARAAARRALADSERRPWARLELIAGALYERSADARAAGFTVGVSAPLPIFGAGRAAAAQARAAAVAEEAGGRVLRATAERAAHRAHAATVAAIDAALAHRAGPAALAGRLVASVEVAYREGDRGLLELLDALRATRSAAVRDLELIHAARAAHLTLIAAQAGLP